jgi:hypothetical protein
MKKMMTNLRNNLPYYRFYFLIWINWLTPVIIIIGLFMVNYIIYALCNIQPTSHILYSAINSQTHYEISTTKCHILDGMYLLLLHTTGTLTDAPQYVNVIEFSKDNLTSIVEKQDLDNLINKTILNTLPNDKVYGLKVFCIDLNNYMVIDLEPNVVKLNDTNKTEFHSHVNIWAERLNTYLYKKPTPHNKVVQILGYLVEVDHTLNNTCIAQRSLTPCVWNLSFIEAEKGKIVVMQVITKLK